MKREFYFNIFDQFQWTDEQFNIALNDHRELLDILGFLGNTFFEKQVNLDKTNYYEAFIFKHVFQSIDLNTLLRGTRFTSKIFNINTTIFNLPSVYILQRALLENYLTFYYLFIQPSSEEEIQCKWIIYKIAGLTSRQNHDILLSSSKKKLTIEKNIIQKLTEELLNNAHFQSLSNKVKKKILKYRPAKIISLTKLFDESNLKKNIFSPAWKLYSNYAHSEYLSIIQFMNYEQNKPELRSAKHLTLFSSLVLTSIFIINLKSLSTEIENNFNKLSKNQIDCIIFFNKIGVK